MSTSAYNFIKDPAAILDYSWDWSQWLQTGETITTSTITPSPGLTIQSSSFTSTVATAWVKGGTAGQPYTVTNEITSSGGRTANRTISIRVQTR